VRKFVPLGGAQTEILSLRHLFVRGVQLKYSRATAQGVRLTHYRAQLQTIAARLKHFVARG
jgi:hypothetical protein